MKLSFAVEIARRVKQTFRLWRLEVKNRRLKFSNVILKIEFFFLQYRVLRCQFRVLCLQTGDPFILWRREPYLWFWNEFHDRFLQRPP